MELEIDNISKKNVMLYISIQFLQCSVHLACMNMKCCLCCVVDTFLNRCKEGFFLGQDNAQEQ